MICQIEKHLIIWRIIYQTIRFSANKEINYVNADWELSKAEYYSILVPFSLLLVANTVTARRLPEIAVRCLQFENVSLYFVRVIHNLSCCSVAVNPHETICVVGGVGAVGMFDGVIPNRSLHRPGLVLLMSVIPAINFVVDEFVIPVVQAWWKNLYTQSEVPESKTTA